MNSPDKRRYIPLRDAAAIVGPRFHKDWADDDADVLAGDRDDDPEAFDRASNVQTLLKNWIVDGDIQAFQDPPPDGSGRAVTDIPPQWYEAASFAICIRTSRFMVFTDAWEPAYVKRAAIVTHLPKVAKLRNPRLYHGKDIVHAAWKLALSQPELPTKASLSRLLLDHIRHDRNEYPDPSTIRDIIDEVVGFLAQNKAGRGISESDEHHDEADHPA